MPSFRPPDRCAKLLRIWLASGKMLAAIPIEALGDVRSLKLMLQPLCGAPRFRQKLLHEQAILQEDAKLDVAMDLQLVLLPYLESSAEQRQELADAAGDGCLAQAEEMLQKPLDPNTACEKGVGPLAMAVAGGHFGMVQLLLEAGADQDMIHSDDLGVFTVLHLAAYRGHLDIAQLLLEAGAEKDALDGDGRTALHFAAHAGHAAIARLLLEAGARKDIADISGRTALMWAAEQGHRDVVDSLLPLADVDTSDEQTFLNLADKDGFTALHLASHRGCQEALALLLRAQANVNLRDVDGRTPLHLACHEGHLATAQALLEAGALKDVANSQGRTPLHVATLEGQVETVRWLLAAGVSKDASDGEGRTALAWAAKQGHVEISRLLLEAQVDMDVVDNMGLTALRLAFDQSHMDILKLLTEACWEPVCCSGYPCSVE